MIRIPTASKTALVDQALVEGWCQQAVDQAAPVIAKKAVDLAAPKIRKEAVEQAVGSIRLKVTQDLVESLRKAGAFGKNEVRVDSAGAVLVRLAPPPPKLRTRTIRKTGEGEFVMEDVGP